MDKKEFIELDKKEFIKLLEKNSDYYEYSCDAGSLLIGNESFRISIHNGIGDGSYCVYVMNETIKGGFYNYVRFITTFEGDNVNLYSYDCLDEFELKHNVLATLPSGRYAIYTMTGDNEGNILIERW